MDYLYCTALNFVLLTYWSYQSMYWSRYFETNVDFARWL